MGETGGIIDIVIFAAIAAFLFWRLRNVLGRRHGGEEQRPNPYAPTARNGSEDKVVPLGRTGRQEAGETPAEALEREGAVAEGSSAMTQLKIADPNFDEPTFLEGAKAAFGMVVDSFAQGDRETLTMLVEPDLLATFIRDVERREMMGQVLDNSIVEFKTATIEDVRLAGASAYVTVRFVTAQTNVLRDTEGAVVEGTPGEVEDIIDVWTFARNLRSDDPNWLLVETRSDG